MQNHGQTVKMVVGQLCVWAELVRCVQVRVQACDKSTPCCGLRDRALTVSLCMRESKPAPPGDPQHKAEGWTQCPRGREHAQRCSYSRPSLFVQESKDPVEMTYSRMDLNERGLLAIAASAKSQ